MKVQVFENFDLEAANLIYQIFGKSNFKLNIALPTGNTPVGMFRELVGLSKTKAIDWKEIKIFMLDSYFPQDPKDDSSFYRFIDKHLLSLVKINKDNFNILYSATSDPEKECSRYEDKIKEVGGLDLIILGIGENGHIAFNEPGTEFETLTHLTNLSEETMRVNKIDIKFGLTMGIKTIFSAKKILVLAKGKKKAEIVRSAIEGPRTIDCPASLLLNHPNIIYLLDHDASSRLSNN